MKQPVFLVIALFLSVIANAQNPSLQWNKGFGSANLFTGQSVATDASGNVYTAGSFAGPGIVIGNTTLINNATDSGSNLFVAKFDSLGNSLFVRGVSGGANEGAEGITALGLGADANGNVYVLGSAQSPLAIFGTDTLVNNVSTITFLVKYNTQGNVVWAINTSTTASVGFNNLAVDASGNCYVSGVFTGGTIIGGTDTIPFAGNYAAYVVKFNSEGNSLWAAGINGPADHLTLEDVFNFAVAVDAGGNVYVAGNYRSDSVVVSGNIILTNPNTPNILNDGMYLVKYTPQGEAAWAQNVALVAISETTGHNFEATPYAITADGEGNVYVTGATIGDTLIFGADTAFMSSSSALSNLFVAAYNSSGTSKWVRCTQGNNNITGTGISATGGGQVFVTGWYGNSSVTVGNTILSDSSTALSANALFIAEYDAAGNMAWATGSLPAQADIDAGASVLADNNGHLYVSGTYAGSTVNLGNGALPFVGNINIQSNVFTAKYDIAETSTGIANAAGNRQTVTVYPNPSAGFFRFNGINSGSTVEVYNILGQSIYTGIAGADNYVVNISAQPKGVYLYRATDNAGVLHQGKIIVE